MVEECVSCGKEYKSVATHWSRSSICSAPDLSDNQEDIITGLVMGDGAVVVPNKNPSLHVKMINDDFLSWVDKHLGWLSNGYTKVQTASEAAEENRKTGFSPNASEENYSDKYTLRTKCVDHLWRWREWYSSGNKSFPGDINMSPVTVKVWYACDGHMGSYNEGNHISITCLNESDSVDKLISLFDNLDVDPVPHNSQRSFSLRFSQSDSQWLWEYMGNAPDGFEHKWP